MIFSNSEKPLLCLKNDLKSKRGKWDEVKIYKNMSVRICFIDAKNKLLKKNKWIKKHQH